ncbi:MAG: glycosyltransferase family 9 protein, partial [Vulcanimicrobiaceae bacterium]
SEDRELLIALGGGVGDTFLASVLARALRKRFAAVDMLAAKPHRAVLQGNPDIYDVLESDDPAQLRGRKYAASVCTWATLENALLPLRAKVPVRVGQARRLYSALFTKRVVVRSERGDRTSHWTQILLDYTRALGCDTDDTQPRVALTDADRADARRLLENARVDGPFAILHPTRGIQNPERWPSAPFGRIVNELVERYRIPVLVTGSQDDRAFVARVFAEARTAPREFAQRSAAAINASGATSLRAFTALAERATVVEGTYPCPPSHRKETCPDFACVQTLPTDPIIAAVDRLLPRDKGSISG